MMRPTAAASASKKRRQNESVASCRSFLGGEAAADGRLDAEHREKTRRDSEPFDLDGARGGADVELDSSKERGFLEDVDALPPPDVVSGRDRRGADAPRCVCLVDLNEAVGVAVRQRLEQYRAGQRKHRGVDAEAEREGGHGDDREAGPGRERAEGSTHGEGHPINSGELPSLRFASRGTSRRGSPLAHYNLIARRG